MNEVEKFLKGTFYWQECKAGKASMTTHSLSATLWEVLIKRLL